MHTTALVNIRIDTHNCYYVKTCLSIQTWVVQSNVFFGKWLVNVTSYNNSNHPWLTNVCSVPCTKNSHIQIRIQMDKCFLGFGQSKSFQVFNFYFVLKYTVKGG